MKEEKGRGRARDRQTDRQDREVTETNRQTDREVIQTEK